MTEVDRSRAAAKRERRGRARERAAFVDDRVPPVDRRAISEAMARAAGDDGAAPRAAGPASLAAANSDQRRWVPIGPAVVRQGQAEGRPRVVGRVRDIAVDPFFRQRIYAATAKGGVWYSRDGGSTWQPVGGWAARARTAGGNNSGMSCGCLLVDFDLVDEAQDLVVIGTGEPPSSVASISAAHPGGRHRDDVEAARQRIHGVGVLAARGPVAKPFGSEPWEAESGLALMENTAIYRLVRDPDGEAGKTANPNRDRVLAATSRGLFLGLRTAVPASDGTPAHREYRWSPVSPAAGPLAGSPIITDAVWISDGSTDGLVVLAMAGPGAAQQVVVVTNVSQATPTVTAVTGLASVARSRVSLAHAADRRVYALGERPAAPNSLATLWRIPDVGVASPAATQIPGLPNAVWGGRQRDYDQALACTVVGGRDRVYVGGRGLRPAAGQQFSAALYAFDVTAAPALVEVDNLSRRGPPAADPRNAGADQAGLIGNNVHADVHHIELVPKPTGHDVWVTCDGGVYLSTQNGRVNTFVPRSTGLAALEVGFHAAHPTSSHFGLIGTQDTGRQVRTGDTVWEQTFLADGGGVAFHPTRSQYVIAQNNGGSWSGQPQTGFVSPLRRTQGGGAAAGAAFPAESGASAFYSGPAAIALSATESRVAIGTNRVWISDDIGRVPTPNWGVIPMAAGPAGDQIGAANAGVGVPPGGLGAVLRLRWITPSHLLALYQRGVVRYTLTGVNWRGAVVIPGAANAPAFAAGREIFTEIAPVPGTNDFYLTTSGNPANAATDTCFFFDSAAGANGTCFSTRLRRQLDSAPGANDGPLDPAYSVIVDPANVNDVYVGTVGGVWRGVRTAGAGHPHNWTTDVNGLPEALVQDLTIWTDPAGGGPRLLRAAIQSRGVWEMDLAAASEPQRTYVRVHARDDRRRIPTPMANPRRRPGAPNEAFFASPDIVVRPRWPIAAAPRWLFGARAIVADADAAPPARIRASATPFQLWTFQTAFRWHFPSIQADGRWSDQFGDLIEQFRAAVPALAAGGRQIDQALWDHVVGTTRLDPLTNAVSTTATDPLAVYRPPWHDAAAPSGTPTEVDMMELVRPWAIRHRVWRVHNEPVTVDVLIHHRDTRPLAASDAFVILLWRDRSSQSSALGGNVSAFPDFARSLIDGPPLATPGGWNLAADGTGATVHRLATPLDARLPRSVSIDVDLSGVGNWRRVALVAIVGSNTDRLTTAPSGAVNTLEQLTRRWLHAAVRLVQMRPRP